MRTCTFRNIYTQCGSSRRVDKTRACQEKWFWFHKNDIYYLIGVHGYIRWKPESASRSFTNESATIIVAQRVYFSCYFCSIALSSSAISFSTTSISPFIDNYTPGNYHGAQSSKRQTTKRQMKIRWNVLLSRRQHMLILYIVRR